MASSVLFCKLCHLVKQLLEILVTNLIRKRRYESLCFISVGTPKWTYRRLASTTKHIDEERNVNTKLRSLILRKFSMNTKQSLYRFDVFLGLEPRKRIDIVQSPLKYPNTWWAIVTGSTGSIREDEAGLLIVIWCLAILFPLCQQCVED